MRRSPSQHLRQSGFTLLEIIVVIAVIGMLIGVAAIRLAPYFAQAERIAVTRVENQLKSALSLEAARHIARSDFSKLIELTDINPMSLMLEPPATYLGEAAGPTVDLIPTRSWIYDLASERLVYRAGPGYGGSRGVVVLREYRVGIEFDDRDGDETFDITRDTFHGVRLISTPTG